MCTAQCGFFIYIDVGHEAPPCRALRAPAGRGSGGASRLRPFFAQHAIHRHRPCRQRRGFAARAHARALALTASRFSVCALSSEAPITPGIHGRRGVPPEARIEAPAPSTRRDPRHHQPLPGNTASAFPLVALRIPQIPQGAWTRSSLGVNSSGPYLGSAEHACQRTFEYLRQLPPPRS